MIRKKGTKPVKICATCHELPDQRGRGCKCRCHKPCRKKANHSRRNKTASKAKMIRELDKSARAEVFARDGEICQRCKRRAGEFHEDGYPVILQWSHVLSRRFYCIRWEADNAKVMCSKCHCWWGNNRGQAEYWFSRNWPLRWERVNEIRLENPKVNVKERWQQLQQSAS